MSALAELVFGKEKVKVTARQRREKKRKVRNDPPRSMTEAEKDYYDQHKTLAGFYAKS